ncbi:hypothetical protein TWF730_006703 [Orbilia blumenaviensis]|uniref:F-box domain-containing protein n=1 Tax=Orbilia blumenaviensis TaxID=1796055 RepID=A0AAV9VFE7_9PEZI
MCGNSLNATPNPERPASWQDLPRNSKTPLNLTTLPQDILTHIVEYLRPCHANKLLTTCKTLYPTFQRQVWSALKFDGRYDEQREAGIVILIIKKGVDKSPLQFVRTRRIGERFFTAESVLEKREFLQLILLGLLYSNEINLRHVELIMTGLMTIEMLDYNSGRSNYPEPPLYETNHEYINLLKDLRKYSQKREARGLVPRIGLRTNIVDHIPHLFHLQAITQPTIETPKCGSINKFWITRRTEGPKNSSIQQTADLFADLANLNMLSWKDNRDAAPDRLMNGTLSKELAELQNIVTGMRKLRELRLEYAFFHPSLFLVPPENVKTLEVSKMSKEWWYQFAECPLSSIRVLKVSGGIGYEKLYRISRVAIRGRTRGVLRRRSGSTSFEAKWGI